MKSVRLALLAVVVLILGAIPATAQTKDKVTVGFPTVDPTAEVLYAYDLGYFDRAGLDVTLQPFANGGAIATGVASGALDFGVGNVISIEAAHRKGVPLVIVAPGAANVNSAPSNVLIVTKDSPLHRASDLNGKVVATNPLLGIGQLMTDEWMDRNGGDSSTVKYIEIPFPDAEGAVVQGRVAASLSVEPFITQSRNDARVFSNPFSVYGDNWLITAFFANGTWAQAHPAIVQKFATAIHDAGVWANANPAKSAEILAKYAHLDPAVVRQTIRARYAVTLTPRQLQVTIDGAAKYKIIDSAFPAQDIIFH